MTTKVNDNAARSHAGTPPASLGHRLFDALERLWTLRRPGDRDAVCCHGVTKNQAALLRLLCRNGDEALAMSLLAAQLNLTPSGVTRCAEPLVERGLVERRARPGDRRVCCLLPTAAGRALWETIARECAEQEERLLHHLPPEDRRMAVRAVELLAGAAELERTKS